MSYSDTLKNEKLNIEQDRELLDSWQSSASSRAISFLPKENIIKKDTIFGRIAYLWETPSNKGKIGYCYDGMLKGKVLLKYYGIFNSIKEYCEYYRKVISKENDTIFIAKHGIEEREYASYEVYSNRVLSREKDDNIEIILSKEDEKNNFYICKKLLRIWKYKKTDENDNIPDVEIMETVLQLLPKSNLNILDEYLNINEEKNIVSLICEKIASSNQLFALDKMEYLLEMYKQDYVI